MLRRPVAAGYTSQIDVWFATNILTFGSRMPEARAPRLCHAGVAGIDTRNRSLRGFCPHWGRALVDWRDGAPAGPIPLVDARLKPSRSQTNRTGSRESRHALAAAFSFSARSANSVRVLSACFSSVNVRSSSSTARVLPSFFAHAFSVPY